MKASRTLSQQILAASLAAFAACGDSDDNSSGVSSAKTVAEVTDEDAKKLCLWTYEQTQDVNFSDRDLCEAGAVSMSETTSKCNALVDACLKNPPVIEDEGPDCDDADPSDLPAGCGEITVGDYQACMRAIFAAFKKDITGASCDKPGESFSLENVLDDLPKSCESIAKDCPELLPGEDEG